ncbi:proline and serine-rich protein 3 isoform X2 [Eucyclogobius newberryi]|uniref:proline and serine-rich protein 3 isoform X2 n=1 Tax=Eucyclogobius newberryi TaxID=166745 RepID=UPI003B5BAD76
MTNSAICCCKSCNIWNSLAFISVPTCHVIMKGSDSKLKATRTQSLMGKSNRLSKIPSQPKTKKKDGKQNYSTDSDPARRPVFTEIWPSEPFSPSDTPTSDKNVPQSSRFKSCEEDTEPSSVLARYVDRFRHGHPQSREERQQNSEEEQLPFWWASSPSLPPNLTPKKTDERLPRHNRSISPCRGSPSVLSESSQCEPYDSEILQLQERASRLLQKGEFCLEEDSLPVSSDGIGCSDFSSPVSADESVRKPMISSLPKYNIAKDLPSVMPSSVTPLHREEDILFQWRLRRKMENAREWSQSKQHFNPRGWQGFNKSQPLHSEQRIMESQTIYPPDLPQGTTRQSIIGPHFSTLDQQTTVTGTTTTMPAVPSGSVVSSPQALSHVPSHMHLLCDILPCPNRPSYPHEDETVSQTLGSQIGLHQKLQHIPSEPYIIGHVEKDEHLAHTKSTKEPKKQTENTEKKVPLFSKEQKKLARVHSRHRMASKITTSTLQHQHKHTDKKSRPDGAPPPPPIESALGQVVSEVLFPSMDSTIVQDCSPSSPPCFVSEPQQSNYYESVKVISQFLQEAEDSDEKEFEDDPLLQVLRKQRQWVKKQIDEVDTLLKEFEVQHKM